MMLSKLFLITKRKKGTIRPILGSLNQLKYRHKERIVALRAAFEVGKAHKFANFIIRKELLGLCRSEKKRIFAPILST